MSDASDSAPALEVALRKQVHSELSLDVSFRLGAECGVVFGRSGAGKTTLLRLIAGLDRPDAGFVRIGPDLVFDRGSGVEVPLRRRRIGMVFQHNVLFPHLDVAGNIRFGLNDVPRASRESRVEEVATLCGVERLLGRRPVSLSGGERQRVGLARALAPRPRLLLCDEPVSALDVASRHALIANLRLVQVSSAIPMLYVTHSLSEAVALGSVLFRLESGRITASGLPLDVLASAGTAWPAGAEGLRNIFRARVAAQDRDGHTTVLQLDGGPTLIVPRLDEALGKAVTVEILAGEILLARGEVGAVSARNVIPGLVERVVPHGSDAEVLVRTAGLVWVVSVVETAVTALALEPGTAVNMVVKARSCRCLENGEPGIGPGT
ncbi:MAG: ATP-binding cassette domain-containing protein [Isosphaeraceae bacterium]